MTNELNVKIARRLTMKNYQAEAYKRIAIRWCQGEGLEYEE